MKSYSKLWELLRKRLQTQINIHSNRKHYYRQVVTYKNSVMKQIYFFLLNRYDICNKGSSSIFLNLHLSLLQRGIHCEVEEMKLFWCFFFMFCCGRRVSLGSQNALNYRFTISSFFKHISAKIDHNSIGIFLIRF